MNVSVHNASFLCALIIAALGMWIIPPVQTARGSSAVAVALDPKTERLSFAYWKGEASEKGAQQRAIRYCKSMGWRHPKVIHSTSRDGYGAIVAFDKGDNKSHFAAAVGAATPKQAINGALQNAKAAELKTTSTTYSAGVVFFDGKKIYHIIMQTWPKAKVSDESQR